MAGWEGATWASEITSGLPRRDRRGGDYRTYRPDSLVGVSLMVSAQLDAVIAKAERAARSVRDHRDLVGVARFLLRSEAIASSRIEGIAPSPGQIALAELAWNEDTPRVTDLARLVAQNMTIVQEARTQLAETQNVSLDRLVALHAALLTDQPELHGIRTVQNWIGGSAYHPIDAEFVPPRPERVGALLEDLLTYLNGASHSPIVQAALVHAQFETIHPFADGNGRVGRALIHTVFARRGLTPEAVLPVSLVLGTLRHAYVDGLTAYRHASTADSPEAHRARAMWIDVFAQAVIEAARQAASLADDLADLRADWAERVAACRDRDGRDRKPRRDSATAQILANLPAMPVMSVATVQRVLGVSHVAAARALEELLDAGVLSALAGRGRRLFQATDVLDLIASTERRLASTRFDTRVSPPVRPVPALPEH